MIALLTLFLAIKTLDVSPTEPAPIVCALEQTTTVELPEEAVEMKVPPAAVTRALGFRIVRSKPRTVISFTPREAVKGRFIFVGASATVELALSTIDRGEATEYKLNARRKETVRPTPRPTEAPARRPMPTAEPTDVPNLTAAATATPTPTLPPPTPQPTATPTAAPSATPSPKPAALAPTLAPPAPTAVSAPAAETGAEPTEEFAWKELGLAGKPINLNEVQGMPGQRPMVLVYAQEGPVHVWFRFRVRGGSDLEVKLVEGPAGPLAKAHYVSEVEKKDLLLFVQLRKELWKKRGGMRITLSNNVPYKFRLRNAGLLRVITDVTDAVNPF